MPREGLMHYLEKSKHPGTDATGAAASPAKSGAAALERVFVALDELLDQGIRRVRLPVSKPDQLLFCDWLQSKIVERYRDVHLQHAIPASSASGQFGLALDFQEPAGVGGVEAPVVVLELPPLTNADLAAVLYFRRREQCLHHGMLIPRQTQLRALEMAECGPQEDRLSRACDLIDQAALILQQSLFQLATT